MVKAKVFREQQGDGGTLRAVLYSKEGSKRFYVQVHSQGKMVENKPFNKKSNADKYFDKVVEEF